MTLHVDPDELIPDTVAAVDLHQQTGTLAAWRNQGRGPAYVKIGRRVFYRRADIASWLAGQRREPKTAALRRSA
jgi:hypothetical protein